MKKSNGPIPPVQESRKHCLNSQFWTLNSPEVPIFSIHQIGFERRDPEHIAPDGKPVAQSAGIASKPTSAEALTAMLKNQSYPLTLLYFQTVALTALLRTSF
jgi:hypothetical protein